MHLIARRCGIHHLGLLHTVGRHRLEQGNHLLVRHGGQFSIDHQRHRCSAQTEVIFLRSHTWQQFQGFEGIAGRRVLDKGLDIKYELGPIHLHHWLLPGNHQFGKGG